jgi:hypothetical protein
MFKFAAAFVRCRAKSFLQAALVIVILAFGVGLNGFGVISPSFRNGFQDDSEALVISTINERTSGRSFFAPMLMPDGMGNYVSSVGLQGIFHHALAELTDLPTNEYRSIARQVTAMLTAVIFGLYIVLVSPPGLLVVALAAIFVSLSPWLVAVAPNLYWSPFLWLLPGVIALAFLRNARCSISRTITLYLLVGFSVTLKCLAGYEYLSAIAVSVCIAPLCASQDKVLQRATFVEAGCLFLCVCAGFIAAVFLQVYQLSVLDPGAYEAFLSRVTENTAGSTGAINALDLLRTKIVSQWPSWIAGPLLSIAGSDRVLSIFVFMRYFVQPALVAPASHVADKLQDFLFPQLPMGALALWIVFRAAAPIRKYRLASTSEDRVAVAALVTLCGCLSWHLLAWGHMVRHGHLNSVLFLIGFIPIACRVMAGDLIRLVRRLDRQSAVLTKT